MDLAMAAAPARVASPAAALTLDQAAIGARVRVVAVHGELGLRRRLLEMGLCNRTEVAVVRRAPMGDPIEIDLRGYHLSLRAEQARFVAVEPA